MKKLLISAAILLSTIPAYPSFAQQVVELDECVRVKEVYVPGRYDAYGNYVPGRVESKRYRIPCAAQYPRAAYYGGPVEDVNVYNVNPAPVARTAARRRALECDPTKTALGGVLGGGVAASMSRGNGYRWSVPVGAFLGGAAFGCRY